MPFDHSVSLDIISAHRRCFGTINNMAPEGHDPCTRPVIFLCVVKLNTRLIGKELTMVRVNILLLFFKPEINLLTLPFFANILISLPGAGFLAFSIYSEKELKEIRFLLILLHLRKLFPTKVCLYQYALGLICKISTLRALYLEI